MTVSTIYPSKQQQIEDPSTDPYKYTIPILLTVEYVLLTTDGSFLCLIVAIGLRNISNQP